jgi:hypothetical protein
MCVKLTHIYKISLEAQIYYTKSMTQLPLVEKRFRYWMTRSIYSGLQRLKFAEIRFQYLSTLISASFNLSIRPSVCYFMTTSSGSSIPMI